MAAQLKENEREKETAIGAVMTVTAADGVLQNSKMLQVAEANAGEAKLRRLAARTNHGWTTIRVFRSEIQGTPPEGLLSRVRFRCTVSAGVFL